MAGPALTGRPTPEAAESVLSFWFVETKPHQWFRRDRAFDASLRARFSALHRAAAARRLDVWRVHPRHCLALILLLDQFSRNIYRDDARAFAEDAHALDIATEAIRRRFDFLYGAKERAFFYLPFMHAEDLSAQERALALFKARLPDSMNLRHAAQHHEIVKRFGRFPHRNRILGRASTADEIAFLKHGGFNP